MKHPVLLPLVPLYAAALWTKQRFLEGGPDYARHLTWPVVSVGSLSAGGAGKTPVVAALAELLLTRRGFTVDVLSRGYGRTASSIERVDPQGSAARFGDEPLLLARRGLEVWVGADRCAAGRLAEATGAGPRVHLLDDGLQHRRLARALDVVLLTREDVADRLLPAGNLREPLTHLRQASAVVLREEEVEALRPVVHRLAGDIPVWVIRRRLTLSPILAPGLSSGPFVAFCGIARPEGFFAMLRTAGMALQGTVAFGDHHRYQDRDVQRLRAMAKGRGLVTTEKDAVKLSAEMRERLGDPAVARLHVDFLEEEAVAKDIASSLPSWPRQTT